MTYKWCRNFSGEVFFGSTFSCGHIAIDLPGELSVIRRAPNQCPAKGVQGGVWRGSIIARGHQRLMASSNRNFGRADRRVLRELSALAIFGRADTWLRQSKYDESDPHRYRR
jgi:hypothetical protein